MYLQVASGDEDRISDMTWEERRTQGGWRQWVGIMRGHDEADVRVTTVEEWAPASCADGW